MPTSQFSVALAVDVDVQTMSIFAKSATIQKVQRPQRKNAKSYKKKETKQKKKQQSYGEGGGTKREGRTHYEITFNYSFALQRPQARQSGK